LLALHSYQYQYAEENSVHLFLHCNIFGLIWHHIYMWLGMSMVTPFDVGIILISFLVVVVSQRLTNLFYRFYGLQLRGNCGKKEIIGSSMEKYVLWCRWLIKLSHSLSCGWRQSFLIFPSIIMVGGSTPSLFWA